MEGIHTSERRFVAIDTSDSVSCDTAKADLDKFFQTAGPDAIAVSFVHLPTEMFGERTMYWRAVFGQDEDFRLWGESYRKLDQLIPDLPKLVSEVVTTYYHESAQDLFQSIVLLECERRFGKGVVFIVSPGDLPAYFPIAQRRRITVKLFLKAAVGIPTVFARAASRRIRRAPARCASGFMWLLGGVGISLQRHKTGDSYEYRLVARPPRLTRAFATLLEMPANMLIRIRQVKHLVLATRTSVTTRSKQQRPQALLLTVEDSGTRVNLNPALKILGELKRRGENVIALSSYGTVASEIREAGIDAISISISIPDRFFGPKTRAYLQKLQACLESYPPEAAESLFFRRLHSKMPNYLRSIRAVKRTLYALGRRVRATAVLTVYESLPLSMTCGHWATESGIPWVGFFPILVGDRPDANHFPAPKHLVYGEQLRDKMIAYGCNPLTIEVVGTPTFDAMPTRDRQADSAYISAQFPHTVGKKLVVVATEAFALPLIELDPILRALAQMEDVAVVLKIHPSDSVHFYESFVNELGNPDNIVVVQKCDLTALLGSADLLMAILSNVIITAAALGTPTLVCDFSQKTRVLDFVKEGLCAGCYSPGDISKSVRALLFDSESRADAQQRLAYGLKRFNGPNDGDSHKRIAGYLQAVSSRGRRWRSRSGLLGRSRSLQATLRESANTAMETLRRG